MEISVKLHPKSSKREIKKVSNSEYEIYVRSVPTKNAANMEMIEVVSEHFKVPKSKIVVTKGSRSKQKILSIGIEE
jgi:hypothetical protein